MAILIATLAHIIFTIMELDAFDLNHQLTNLPFIILYQISNIMINLTLSTRLHFHPKILPNPKNYLTNVVYAVLTLSTIENQNLLANGIIKSVHIKEIELLAVKIFTIKTYMKSFSGLLILYQRKNQKNRKNINKNKINLNKFRKHPLKGNLSSHLQ